MSTTTEIDVPRARRLLTAAGFVEDPTWQGYERWTHFGLDLTVVRQPYMRDPDWVEAVRNILEISYDCRRAHQSAEQVRS